MVSVHFQPSALFFLLLFWNLVAFALAGIVNRTIDDAFGDSVSLRQVTYLPTTASVWQNATCSGCRILPDTSRTFKGTYTAATYNPNLGSISITMKFNGTAIYVFFILANNAGDGITSLTLANFTLDGGSPELFQHTPNLTTTDIDYNQLVYSKQDFVNSEHTLVISTSGVNTNVYVNFDYAIYTYEDDVLPLSSSTSLPVSSPTTLISTPSSITSSDTNTSLSFGPIIGVVIGGTVFLALLTFLLLCLRRRRGRLEPKSLVPPPMMGEMPSPGVVIPFVAQPTPKPFPSASQYRAGHNNNSSTALTYQISQSDPSESFHGGYADSNANQSAASESGSGHQSRSRGATFVNNGNHLLSPDTAVGFYATAVNHIINGSSDRLADPSSVEIIRRRRQNEIDERLRAVQQEMTHLTSDLGEEKGDPSVRRRRTITEGSQEVGEEGEMSMAEMKEQLRVMKEQIQYLREQQLSAWAQGMSDDPPPGYTPALASRYSAGQTFIPLS